MESLSSEKTGIDEGKKLSLDLSFRGKLAESKMKDVLDENANIVEMMEQCPGSTISGGITPLLPQIKNLNFEESLQAPLYHPFGKIENVIDTMGLALVQSTTSALILDIDTPVFVASPDPKNSSTLSYTILGQVDDILGSVGTPMYSIRLAPGISPNSSSRFIQLCNSPVYVQSCHPNTNILRVKSTAGQKYFVVSDKNASFNE